ncbi:MAG: alpha/beta hydrolase [Acidobacteriota bacterium]|nr:alpha/beta hydrolase [Acidobacteriota bacterium]
MGRMVVKVVVVVVVAWVVLVAAVWLFQRKLIYIPLTSSVAPVAQFLPEAEEVVLETEDGLRLGAWFVPATEDPNGVTVIVFNGNAGDRSFRTPLASALSQLGFATLLFDYRGYGGNPGRPSEAGLAADARAAIGYLEGRNDVDSNRIVYFGESLGTGVAVGLAVERPPAALILRSPFTSLVDAGSRHYRFLPVRLLMWDRYPSKDRIAGLGCPVLVIAGERDRIVPTDLSVELYEAAADPKRLVLIPGAGHNDLALLAGDRLLAAILRFLLDMAILEPEPGSGVEA